MKLNLGKFAKPFAGKTGRGTGGEPAPEVVDAEDVRITEVTGMVEPLEPAEDLAATKEQLKQLSDTMYGAGGGGNGAVKDALAQLFKAEGVSKARPVRPPAELEVKPEAAPDVEVGGVKVPLALEHEVKANDVTVPASPLKELKLQSLKISEETGKNEVTEVVAPPPGGAAAEAKPAASVSPSSQAEDRRKEAGDAISQIFNQEEVEVDPLAGLMASLPQATLRELLDEARELETLLAGWPQS